MESEAAKHTYFIEDDRTHMFPGRPKWNKKLWNGTRFVAFDEAHKQYKTKGRAQQAANGLTASGKALGIVKVRTLHA